MACEFPGCHDLMRNSETNCSFWFLAACIVQALHAAVAMVIRCCLQFPRSVFMVSSHCLVSVVCSSVRSDLDDIEHFATKGLELPQNNPTDQSELVTTT